MISWHDLITFSIVYLLYHGYCYCLFLFLLLFVFVNVVFLIAFTCCYCSYLKLLLLLVSWGRKLQIQCHCICMFFYRVFIEFVYCVLYSTIVCGLYFSHLFWKINVNFSGPHWANGVDNYNLLTFLPIFFKKQASTIHNSFSYYC